MSARVLIVEADSARAESLQIALAQRGYDATCASDAAAAESGAAGGVVGLILWGLQAADRQKSRVRLQRLLPEATWIEILGPEDPADLHRNDPRVADILRSPVAAETLSFALRRAERFRALEGQNQLLRAEIEAAVGDRPIVAASPGMIRVLEETERAAGSAAPVLLLGEPGTGREGVARAIHAQSPRRHGPFVATHAASGSEGERALFGTVERGGPVRRGAIASANGGTLYLERPERLDPTAQARLLEILSTGSVQAVGGEKTFQVDLRLIVGSTRSLDADVATGRFDGALLEQLSGLQIPIPPLRERKEDLPLLVDHFFARSARDSSHPLRGLADDALQRLTAYDWPGNVRELESVIGRAVLLATGEVVTAADLAGDLERGEPEASPRSDLGLRRARRRAEIEIIRRALRQTGGNRTHAARLLEISHRALLYKLKDYGLKD